MHFLVHFLVHFLLHLARPVFSLLFKKDKDPLDCASCRPISLLNTDVKILPKVLAHRLEDILPSVISPDQTGFIEGRNSFYNTRRLFNILYSTKHIGSECLTSMDAEKAFDRVELLIYDTWKIWFRSGLLFLD